MIVPVRRKILERYHVICFCDRSWIFSVAFSGYELQDDPPMNWTSAAETWSELAKIASIEELCEAQAEIRLNYGYWTALKFNSMGRYQWGHLANNTANITDPEELLDRTEPVDRCYVINRSEMKLLSKDCDSPQRVLLSYRNGADGKHTFSSSHQKRIHVFPFTSTK